MERRRKRALVLHARGLSQTEIARKLDVKQPSVHRWLRAAQAGGPKALLAAGRAGRKPRLDDADLTRVRAALLQDPEKHGFSGALWTLPRVAKLIERLTGVKYHEGHVWKILRGVLGFSLQRPVKRAAQRNEAALNAFPSREWRAIKKKPADSMPGSFSRTKAG